MYNILKRGLFILLLGALAFSCKKAGSGLTGEGGKTMEALADEFLTELAEITMNVKKGDSGYDEALKAAKDNLKNQIDEEELLKIVKQIHGGQGTETPEITILKEAKTQLEALKTIQDELKELYKTAETGKYSDGVKKSIQKSINFSNQTVKAVQLIGISLALEKLKPAGGGGLGAEDITKVKTGLDEIVANMRKAMAATKTEIEELKKSPEKAKLSAETAKESFGFRCKVEGKRNELLNIFKITPAKTSSDEACTNFKTETAKKS